MKINLKSYTNVTIYTQKEGRKRVRNHLTKWVALGGCREEKPKENNFIYTAELSRDP